MSLREALDNWERIGVKGPVYDAARRLLEAEEREWCATHDEPMVMGFGASVHVVGGECEIVAKLLVDPQEGESE